MRPRPRAAGRPTVRSPCGGAGFPTVRSPLYRPGSPGSTASLRRDFRYDCQCTAHRPPLPCLQACAIAGNGGGAHQSDAGDRCRPDTGWGSESRAGEDRMTSSFLQLPSDPLRNCDEFPIRRNRRHPLRFATAMTCEPDDTARNFWRGGVVVIEKTKRMAFQWAGAAKFISRRSPAYRFPFYYQQQ